MIFTSFVLACLIRWDHVAWVPIAGLIEPFENDEVNQEPVCAEDVVLPCMCHLWHHEVDSSHAYNFDVDYGTHDSIWDVCKYVPAEKAIFFWLKERIFTGHLVLTLT